MNTSFNNTKVLCFLKTIFKNFSQYKHIFNNLETTHFNIELSISIFSKHLSTK